MLTCSYATELRSTIILFSRGSCDLTACVEEARSIWRIPKMDYFCKLYGCCSFCIWFVISQAEMPKHERVGSSILCLSYVYASYENVTQVVVTFNVNVLIGYTVLPRIERHAVMERILPGCRYTLRYNGMPL